MSPDDLERYLALARDLADQFREPALVCLDSDPGRFYCSGSPYVTLLSQASPWERANALATAQPRSEHAPAQSAR